MNGKPQSGQELIRIYQVLEPGALVAARDPLAAIFAGRAEDSDVHVSVSADGGRWWYADDRVLWRTVDPARLPQSPLAAEAAARRFIGRIGQAMQNDQELQGLRDAGITRLFPDDLRPALISLAMNPDRGIADHWLVRFEAYLPTSTSSGSIPVFGAVTDIRVGQDSAVGGFWLAWRPCISPGVKPLIQLPGPSAGGSGNGAPPPTLLYRLAGEGVPQTYVAPYYFVAKGDDGDFFPASQYSIVAKIIDDPQPEMFRVMAAVTGGSGKFVYRWAGWDLTDPVAGIADWGSDSGVMLEAGAYNVILSVTDLMTGAIGIVQRSVFTDMFAVPGASA